MLSNLNPNYKDLRNKQQINLLKQNSIKKIVHETKTNEIYKEEPKIKMDEIYNEKDEKEELTKLLQELSINRNKKKKK
jgi:Na+-transporting NADH:ubiquinone oxidoreductase subunit NqrC